MKTGQRYFNRWFAVQLVFADVEVRVGEPLQTLGGRIRQSSFDPLNDTVRDMVYFIPVISDLEDFALLTTPQISLLALIALTDNEGIANRPKRVCGGGVLLSRHVCGR